ncbi:NLR family CARD domain-containing protein 4-like isoform X2 [Petromyzon marinus]
MKIPDEVLNEVESLNIITKREYRDLKSVTKPSQRINQLIDKISGKANDQIKQFVNVALNNLQRRFPQHAIPRYRRGEIVLGHTYENAQRLKQILEYAYNKTDYRRECHSEMIMDTQAVYMDLTLCEKAHDGSGNGMNYSNVEEFVRDNTSRLTIILGEAGAGKTTNCKQIAVTWAEGRLEEYQLVIHLNLREISKGETLGCTIRKQLLPIKQELTEDEIIQAIESVEEKTLFILDGYDEYPHMEKQSAEGNISNLIRQNYLPKSRIILNSRPWRVRDVELFAEKKIHVDSLSRDDSQLLIVKVMSTSSLDIDNAKKQINHYLCQDLLDELIKRPFNATLLGLILKDEDHDLSERKPQTNAYDLMISHKIQQYIQKYNLSLSNKEQQELCNDIGKIAFKGILEKRQKFNRDDFKDVNIDHSLKLDLIREEGNPFNKQEQKYSIISCEYLAGRYLDNVLSSDRNVAKSTERKIQSLISQENVTENKKLLLFASASDKALKVILEKLLRVLKHEHEGTKKTEILLFCCQVIYESQSKGKMRALCQKIFNKQKLQLTYGHLNSELIRAMWYMLTHIPECVKCLHEVTLDLTEDVPLADDQKIVKISKEVTEKLSDCKHITVLKVTEDGETKFNILHDKFIENGTVIDYDSTTIRKGQECFMTNNLLLNMKEYEKLCNKVGKTTLQRFIKHGTTGPFCKDDFKNVKIDHAIQLNIIDESQQSSGTEKYSTTNPESLMGGYLKHVLTSGGFFRKRWARSKLKSLVPQGNSKQNEKLLLFASSSSVTVSKVILEYLLIALKGEKMVLMKSEIILFCCKIIRESQSKDKLKNTCKDIFSQQNLMLTCRHLTDHAILKDLHYVLNHVPECVKCLQEVTVDLNVGVAPVNDQDIIALSQAVTGCLAECKSITIIPSREERGSEMGNIFHTEFKNKGTVYECSNTHTIIYVDNNSGIIQPLVNPLQDESLSTLCSLKDCLTIRHHAGQWVKLNKSHAPGSIWQFTNHSATTPPLYTLTIEHQYFALQRSANPKIHGAPTVSSDSRNPWGAEILKSAILPRMHFFWIPFGSG